MKKQKTSDPARGLQSFAGFGVSVLGKSFYPKQQAVLDALNPFGSSVSFLSCNEGGKTNWVLPTAILSAMALHNAKVISTSGSFRQIKDQLIPALKGYQGLFSKWDFQDKGIRTPDPKCFYSGFSTDDAGLAEGDHAEPGHPLMIIVDEAKSVKDAVYQGIERCKPTWLLLTSSAGFAAGEFFRSWTTRAKFYTRIKQTAHECPHWKKEDIESWKEKWGAESAFFKSVVEAEFMPFVEGAIVQLAALDELLANPPQFIPGERKLFCDFAWSDTAAGDENVMAMRNGNRITIEAAFRARGIPAVCAEFVRHFVRLGFSQKSSEWEIEGDADGEGSNIIDQLALMGWRIGRAHNGGKPRWNEHYKDLAAEMWCEGAQAIIRKEFILPDDSDLYGQMLDRKIVPHPSGKLAIESKRAMKDSNRVGGACQCSPDRADAVFGAMARTVALRSTQLVRDTEPIPIGWLEPQEEPQSHERRYFQ
jgi:phage terminase large subunit